MIMLLDTVSSADVWVGGPAVIDNERRHEHLLTVIAMRDQHF